MRDSQMPIPPEPRLRSAGGFSNWVIVAFIAVLLLIGIAVYLTVKSGQNPTAPPHAETKRTGTINAHQSESTKEKQAIATIDSTRKPIQERQIKERIVYRYIRVADEKLEQEYKQGKIKADSVIKSKNHRIAKAEALQARSDSLQGLDSLKIKSLTWTVVRQESVITELNTGWQQANVDNARLAENIAKQKRKRFGLGFSAGYGMTDTGLSPQVSVSLNYNLIKF